MNDEIIIDVVLGAESKSLVINETRVAGELCKCLLQW